MRDTSFFINIIINMGITGKLLAAIVVSVAAYVGFQLNKTETHTLPDYFKDDHYWGAKTWKVGEPVPKDDPKINKFTIKVEDSILTDLKSRLNRTRFTSSIPGVNFEYGFNCDHLNKVVDYWINKYDWRKEEAALNKYPQFTTQIEGLTIHYYHIKPSVKAEVTRPLLMQHGWPGSVVEFQKIIPLLTTDSDLNFELIIPSLPGYGWSEASHKPGLSIVHVARIMSKLMTRLGHDRFLFHAGDWGSQVGRSISVLYPDRVIGFHNTLPTTRLTDLRVMIKMAIGSVCPSCIYDRPDSDVLKVYPVMDKFYRLLRGTGYMHIQSTRPDTVSVCMSDSPAALASYILEKFSLGTNGLNMYRPDGGLTDRFTIDELLTNVMVYWVTNTITSSNRLYKETINYHYMNVIGLDRIVIPKQVPLGLAIPESDIMRFPTSLLRHTYPNVVYHSDLKGVGHFTCFEDPELMAKDIKSFVQFLLREKQPVE